MKRKKLTKRKELKLLTIIISILAIENVILMSFLFNIVLSNDETSPQIDFYKHSFRIKYINETNYYQTRGKYNSIENKIYVDLSYGKTGYIVLHEFSHYMYKNYLSKDDIKQWKKICGFTLNKTIFKTYREDEKCEEWFAYNNGHYLNDGIFFQENNTNSIINTYLFTINNKYIK